MDELITTDRPSPQSAEMRPYSAAELKAAVLANSQARLLSVARIPDRPPAVRRAEQSRHRRADARGARRARRRSDPSCAGSSRTRRSAMAASAGSRPASWRAWRRWRSRHGYGIRYDHGLFRQIIRNGWQQEYPDDWLASATPGNSSGPRSSTHRLRRRVEARSGEDGRDAHVWHPARRSRRSPTTRRSSAGAAGTSTRCGCGRRARPTRSSSTRSTPATMSARCADSVRAEAISKVLYPSDETPAGQELRLRQEYFFASASLQDLFAAISSSSDDVRTLASKGRRPAQRHPSRSPSPS
jgi:hypothetical protein